MPLEPQFWTAPAAISQLRQNGGTSNWHIQPAYFMPNSTDSELRSAYRSSLRKERTGFNHTLQTRLLPLLLDAHDASTMTPARLHVTLDRIDQAVAIVREEAAKLEALLKS